MSRSSRKQYFRTKFKVVTGGPAAGPNGTTRASGILDCLDKLVDESEEAFVPFEAGELDSDKAEYAANGLRPLLAKVVNALGQGGTVTPAAPTITSFTPTSGLVNSVVTITGTNFTGATAVTINGIDVSGFVVNSSTQITATLTGTQVGGLVRVTTAGGTATGSSFTVTSGGGTPITITLADADFHNNTVNQVTSAGKRRTVGSSVVLLTNSPSLQLVSHSTTMDYPSSSLLDDRARVGIIVGGADGGSQLIANSSADQTDTFSLAGSGFRQVELMPWGQVTVDGVTIFFTQLKQVILPAGTTTTIVNQVLKAKAHFALADSIWNGSFANKEHLESLHAQIRASLSDTDFYNMSIGGDEAIFRFADDAHCEAVLDEIEDAFGARAGGPRVREAFGINSWNRTPSVVQACLLNFYIRFHARFPLGIIDAQTTAYQNASYIDQAKVALIDQAKRNAVAAARSASGASDWIFVREWGTVYSGVGELGTDDLHPTTLGFNGAKIVYLSEVAPTSGGGIDLAVSGRTVNGNSIDFDLTLTAPDAAGYVVNHTTQLTGASLVNHTLAIPVGLTQATQHYSVPMTYSAVTNFHIALSAGSGYSFGSTTTADVSINQRSGVPSITVLNTVTSDPSNANVTFDNSFLLSGRSALAIPLLYHNKLQNGDLQPGTPIIAAYAQSLIYPDNVLARQVGVDTTFITTIDTAASGEYTIGGSGTSTVNFPML